MLDFLGEVLTTPPWLACRTEPPADATLEITGETGWKRTGPPTTVESSSLLCSEVVLVRAGQHPTPL